MTRCGYSVAPQLELDPTHRAMERTILRGSTIIRMLPVWASLIAVPAIMEMSADNGGRPLRCLA